MNNVMIAGPRTFYHQPPAPAPVALPGYTVPLPEKMEVRVVEYEKDNRIVKVELQYRMHYFDQFGQPVTTSDWEAVERVRISMDGI